jgi:hypothetical protein
MGRAGGGGLEALEGLEGNKEELGCVLYARRYLVD